MSDDGIHLDNSPKPYQEPTVQKDMLLERTTGAVTDKLRSVINPPDLKPPDMWSELAGNLTTRTIDYGYLKYPTIQSVMAILAQATRGKRIPQPSERFMKMLSDARSSSWGLYAALVLDQASYHADNPLISSKTLEAMNRTARFQHTLPVQNIPEDAPTFVDKYLKPALLAESGYNDMHIPIYWTQTVDGNWQRSPNLDMKGGVVVVSSSGTASETDTRKEIYRLLHDNQYVIRLIPNEDGTPGGVIDTIVNHRYADLTPIAHLIARAAESSVTGVPPLGIYNPSLNELSRILKDADDRYNLSSSEMDGTVRTILIEGDLLKQIKMHYHRLLTSLSTASKGMEGKTLQSKLTPSRYIQLLIQQAVGANPDKNIRAGHLRYNNDPKVELEQFTTPTTLDQLVRASASLNSFFRPLSTDNATPVRVSRKQLNGMQAFTRDLLDFNNQARNNTATVAAAIRQVKDPYQRAKLAYATILSGAVPSIAGIILSSYNNAPGLGSPAYPYGGQQIAVAITPIVRDYQINNLSGNPETQYMNAVNSWEGVVVRTKANWESNKRGR